MTNIHIICINMKEKKKKNTKMKTKKKYVYLETNLVTLKPIDMIC